MKKNLFLTIALAFAAFAGVNAQNWSLTLSTADGLPGEKTKIAADGSVSEDGEGMYVYQSEKITPDAPLQNLRITFRATEGGNALNGYPFTNLSELTVLAADGVTPITYTATSNADQNALGDADGAGLTALNDGDYSNYWHSAWQGSLAEYHYLELAFTEPVSEFYIKWNTRPGNYYHNAPTMVGLTPAGAEFVPYAEWAFTVGEQITSLDALKNAQYFVMQSNVPVEYDSYKNNEDGEGGKFGDKTNKEPLTGPGPQFVNAGEVASEATPSYAIKLIPAEGGYYLYYVTEGKFLSKHPTHNAYNGANGTQGKTASLSNAALVTITEDGNGRFEMSYEQEYNGKVETIHMGATPSNGGFKNVNEDRYNFYKEGHLYCLNYSYVIKFDWTLYETTMNYPAKYNTIPVKNTLKEADGIYTYMDSVAVEGYEYGYEEFMDVYNETKANLAAGVYNDVEASFAAIDELNSAMGLYVYSKIEWLYYEYLPEVEATYKKLHTSSNNPKDGYYITEVYNECIQKNLIDKCEGLWYKAYENPYAYINEMKTFINSVETNIATFLASQIQYVTLPKVYTTENPDDQGLGTQVGSRYDWEQLVVLAEGTTVKGIRLTFLETVNGNSGGGGKWNGYPMVVLSELQILNENGEKIELSSDLVSTNSLETTEGSLAEMFDDDYGTYYHSIWGNNGTMNPEGYVYLDIRFPEGVQLNRFKVKTSGRGDRVALAPSTVCITNYGEVYDPLIFRENPYNVAVGEKITDVEQLKDGGLYIISGNLRAKTQGAAPRYYSNVAPYHTNIKAAANDPCVYMFKKTENGWNIISLATSKYWALNKTVKENKNEETSEVTESKSWSTGSTVFPSDAAEVKFAKSGNIENTFVIYSDIEDNMISASWNWTNPNDTTDIIKVEAGDVNANKFVYMDWDGGLAGRPCVSELPGSFTYGFDAINAHGKAQEIINGDGYAAGDYLHFNKANGEGEWNIYEVTMDDPYYLWMCAIPETLSQLGIATGNDPGCVTGDIANFEAAVDAINADIAAEVKENAQANVEAFIASVNEVQDVERIKVENNYWYAFESAYTEYYAKQGKVKAMYATETGLAWKDAPAKYNRSVAEFVFQLQNYDVDADVEDFGVTVPEEDKKNVFFIYSDKFGTYAGSGDGTTQVSMTDDLWSANLYIIKPLKANIYTIDPVGDDAKPLHTAGHGEGANANGTIVYWAGEAGSASSWYIRYVDKANGTSVEDLVVEGSEVVSVAYFTPAGAALPAPVKGINIVVTVYANGVIETKKVLVK